MIKDTLQKDMITAFKAGEAQKKSVLSMTIAAIKNKELDKRGKLSKEGVAQEEVDAKSQLTDDEAMDVLMAETKKRKESAELYRVGGRPELAEQEESEAEILKAYLPTQLGDEEVRAQVQATITELGATDMKDMGKVVGAVMTKLKGQTEGGKVSAFAKELLAK